MRNLWHHFSGSILFACAGLALAAVYGWHVAGRVQDALALLAIVAVLAVLEVSLSLDNAVVNAAVLGDMEPIWQARFLTWGMVFAVFATRIVFPLGIVSLAAGLNPWAAVQLSLADPARYAAIMTHAHIAIAGFGGTFLALVALGFFIDPAKDRHWLRRTERRLQGFARIGGGAFLIVGAVLALVAWSLPPAAVLPFLTSALIGAALFLGMEALGRSLEARERIGRTGLASFLYLNVLDASFSLDGTIGAFALTQNMVVIAIGLSIGAMFVRSATMLMVQKATLARYIYLEHGAFWAILTLAAIMLLSARVAVPEAVTGLAGAVLIGAALWSSWRRAP